MSPSISLRHRLILLLTVYDCVAESHARCSATNKVIVVAGRRMTTSRHDVTAGHRAGHPALTTAHTGLLTHRLRWRIVTTITLWDRSPHASMLPISRATVAPNWRLDLSPVENPRANNTPTPAAASHTKWRTSSNRLLNPRYYPSALYVNIANSIAKNKIN